jgi:Mg2+ and Co2+ transporter CorA
MNGIVRKAQRNFEFSLIYEQRKTNQILVAGFRNLAQALEEMTWRITSSVDDLTSSVDRMHTSLNESLVRIHEQTERIASTAEGHRADAATQAIATGARERKALEMLDNIQRKRYPSFMNGGLR